MDQLSLLSGLQTQQYRILYFDLETLRSADEVGGWGNVKDMGVACGVIFDSKTNEYFTYEEKDVDKMIDHLCSADLVVGYNHIFFDYTVLKGYSNVNFSALSNFDMMVDIEKTLGRRMKLDSLVKATLKKQKSADGLQSLQWVKEGRMDLVKAYCKTDVEVTKDLFLFGVENRKIFYSDRDQLKELPISWEIEALVGDKVNKDR